MPGRVVASDGEADSGDEDEHGIGAGYGAAEEGGGKANGTKKKKIRRGNKGKARKIHANPTSQDERETLRKKRDTDSTGARQWEANPPEV
jgi:hypothetical protein